jgi:GntR family transcriptional regulator
MDYRMPIYIQLQDIILNKIEEKKYLPGEAIPSERRLAEKYNVNRMTVKKAINKLVEKGYLYRKTGSGTFVVKRDSKKIDLGYSTGNTSISAIMKESGIQISNKVFGIGDVLGSHYLNYKLGLEFGEIVFGLHRVRMGNGQPVAVEYSYVPKKYFQDIEELDFEKVSLYDYMEAHGHLPIQFNQRLVICEATEKITDLLNIEKGTVIYMIEDQGADSNYNLVEYTRSYFKPAFTEFNIKAQVDDLNQ